MHESTHTTATRHAPRIAPMVALARGLDSKWYHTAYVVTANTSFAFTIYGMKCGLTWDLPPLGILSRGVLVEVYYVVL